MSDYVGPEVIKEALSKITNGAVFEIFAKSFLSSLIGKEFIPSGLIHDKGIDGLEFCISPSGYEKTIYQCSIQTNAGLKISNTLKTLQKNKIKATRVIYVTNTQVKDQDVIFERMSIAYPGVSLLIYDSEWFASNVNFSDSTSRSFRFFVDEYVHGVKKLEQNLAIADFSTDARLFVFLKHQLEHTNHSQKLDEALADTLILFALEGTDPDKQIFKKSAEIRSSIANFVKFDPKLLIKTLDQRLLALSTESPRRINYHSAIDAYCLPYQTRIEIQDRDLRDQALFSAFQKSTLEVFKSALGDTELKIKDPQFLITAVIHKVFTHQGLEFADFVLNGSKSSGYELNVDDVISRVITEAGISQQNQEAVKAALLFTLRKISYQGSEAEKKYLKSLSNTYMLLFMLQCEPQLTTYFQSMAARLEVYVDNSIIIPAFSEYLLEERNRRHWNLLKGAHLSGVRLFINNSILQELKTHLKKIRRDYLERYKGFEDVYTSEAAILYIDEILIRAYFYSRLKENLGSFDDYLENFVSIDFRNADRELGIFLKDHFGIEYQDDESIPVTVNAQEENQIVEILTQSKNSPEKAKNDAHLILRIFAIRAKNNENAKNGMFGFTTWWLSKDYLTMEAVKQVTLDKYQTCYLRPDFLYNYIALAPKNADVDQLFRNVFPTLVGVNLSYHMKPEIISIVHSYIKDHGIKNKTRVKAIVDSLTEKIKSDPNYNSRVKVELFLNEELKKFQLTDEDQDLQSRRRSLSHQNTLGKH